MADAGGYEREAFVAEFYDRIPAYRDRPDVPFYVEAAVQSKGPVLGGGLRNGRVLIRLSHEDRSESRASTCLHK